MLQKLNFNPRNPKFLFGVLLLCLAVGVFFLNSCKKISSDLANTEKNLKFSKSSSENNKVALEISEMMQAELGKASGRGKKNGDGDTTFMSGCTTVTIDSTSVPTRIILDFGVIGCTFRNGQVTYYNSVLGEVYGEWGEPGFRIDVTSQNLIAVFHQINLHCTYYGGFTFELRSKGPVRFVSIRTHTDTVAIRANRYMIKVDTLVIRQILNGRDTFTASWVGNLEEYPVRGNYIPSIIPINTERTHFKLYSVQNIQFGDSAYKYNPIDQMVRISTNGVLIEDSSQAVTVYSYPDLIDFDNCDLGTTYGALHYKFKKKPNYHIYFNSDDRCELTDPERWWVVEY
ncbi:MAG: hypothetical protein SGJ04_07785 [Bacteroidota bacterium]|nr:hypothetical protein [Bacteroidota bacterium]